MIGTVKFFNRVKGFGFITGADGKTYFVSHRNIDSKEPFRYLTDGSQVTFEVLEEPEKKEHRAIRVVETLVRGNGGENGNEIL